MGWAGLLGWGSWGGDCRGWGDWCGAAGVVAVGLVAGLMGLGLGLLGPGRVAAVVGGGCWGATAGAGLLGR